jgi:hypothetical protein
MSIDVDLVVGLYVAALVVFVAGATWGRLVGRDAALADASSLLSDEACRAALHGEDRQAGHLFGLSRRVRELDDPPVAAGIERGPVALEEE